MLSARLDLLHPEPSDRVDRDALEAALVMVFAAGGSDGALETILDAASVAPSEWDPSCFERDVFLQDLVTRCMRKGKRPRVPFSEGLLLRTLANPPKDLATTRFRQEVLRELQESEAARADLERVHAHWSALAGLLSASNKLYSMVPRRWRIDVLIAIRQTVEAMAGAFENAGSGLTRIPAWATAVREGAGFVRLAQLLDLEDGMASLEVRLRVGLDGGLRGFEIVRHEEQATNPFYISALGRFLRRLAFLFRGYRVSDEEMLDRLIDEVFSGVLNDLGTLIAALSDVEFYVSALTFADRARRAGLAVCVPEIVAPPGPHAPPIAREIRDLYNPLLLGEGEGPVPCTLTLDRHDATVVLTGPNSGGKTRFVQAIAIAQALGQAGMFVPASSARLVWARGMLVSILQDTAADQHEGRLGMELVRIRSLFERLGPGSVVLLDELCSGTNPSEGEEIFELVTDLLEELEPQSFITTHFLGLASRLAREREGGRFRFLQVELTEEQRPTYRFIPGIATTSLAKQTAARLGVTRENLRALVAKNRARFAVNGAAAPERAAAIPRRSIEQAAGHTPEGARDDDA